jgi:hypothetical protein
MLQLKGAGPTPYSRTADGLAVLRSSLREFLCSEAMHHLGVPTTRALSLVGTGEAVVRDMFYDGHPRPEPGAVVCRVAPSFTRFGSFQLPAARGDIELLRAQVEHSIRTDYPGLGEPSPETYLAWLAEIAGVNSEQLADDIFNSGSVILANPPEKIVRSDYKIYEEEGIRFAVSQVEELGFGNFWDHAKPIAAALGELREEERLAFAALLVTDINTQNSLLLVKGDATLIQRISYAHVEQDEIFDLPGIVSRKKQLIPYLSSLLKEMAADGVLPTTRNASPFKKKK